jgi:hypothetical protein
MPAAPPLCFGPIHFSSGRMGDGINTGRKSSPGNSQRIRADTTGAATRALVASAAVQRHRADPCDWALVMIVRRNLGQCRSNSTPPTTLPSADSLAKGHNHPRRQPRARRQDPINNRHDADRPTSAPSTADSLVESLVTVPRAVAPLPPTSGVRNNHRARPALSRSHPSCE